MTYLYDIANNLQKAKAKRQLTFYRKMLRAHPDSPIANDYQKQVTRLEKELSLA